MINETRNSKGQGNTMTYIGIEYGNIMVINKQKANFSLKIH